MFEQNVPGTYELLQKATVGIAGCGGLGSNAAVALVRAGIGTLILVDADIVEESNLNRQYFFHADIGKKKVDALCAHLVAINPSVRLNPVDRNITAADVSEVFNNADLLIEAFDSADAKSWLIESWCKAFPERPIVCASGLSGYGNTEAMTVRNAGMIHIVGDGASDSSRGLCSARVAIAANMEANIAIELLVSKGKAA
ncbi:MAG: sulfur carrier protein ThiS adenylyltransferase ThiF [Chitinispirillaceae bacterium]|nr:sulfur carrier protein ThiS adenylyltransferase ThiF [Chitinispirillaceae bacterium]